MANETERPNIVFVLCDDLGINDLNCYGRLDHNTPHLDALAARGMRFTSAYASDDEAWRRMRKWRTGMTAVYNENQTSHVSANKTPT